MHDVFVNWYLVEGDEGVTVVDAGLPRSWSSLAAALAAIGRGPQEIRALLVTHGHVDRGPVLTGRAATADSQLALRSLAELGVRHVLAGHGEPWHDGVAAAADAAHARGPG